MNQKRFYSRGKKLKLSLMSLMRRQKGLIEARKTLSRQGKNDPVLNKAIKQNEEKIKELRQNLSLGV